VFRKSIRILRLPLLPALMLALFGGGCASSSTFRAQAAMSTATRHMSKVGCIPTANCRSGMSQEVFFLNANLEWFTKNQEPRTNFQFMLCPSASSFNFALY